MASIGRLILSSDRTIGLFSSGNRRGGAINVNRCYRHTRTQLELTGGYHHIAIVEAVKSGLTDLQWQTLRQTGTVHLVVISGLHIGFAALAGGWFGRWLAVALMRRKQDQRLPMVLGALLCAGGYALLSGGALPVQRAMLMLAVFMLAWLGMRHVSHWQPQQRRQPTAL